MTTIPTAATIAEWRQLATRPQEHHYMRNAINKACDEIERLQGIHIGLDADIIHANYRAEAAEARETALIVERGNLKARISALEAERDDVAGRLIIMATDEFAAWAREQE